MDCIWMNTCRACLLETDNLHSLFEIYENDISLASILQNFLNVELDCCEQLPTHMCQECATILIQFHNFSVIFEESTRKLRNLVNTQDKEVSDDVQVHDDSKSKILLVSSEEVEIKTEPECDTDTTDSSSSDNRRKCKEVYIFPADFNLESARDQYECKVCGKTFQNLLFFRRHLKLHIDNKKFICEVCGYIAYKKAYLADHMEMHARDKPYECKICGKNFRRRTAFSRHKRIHTNPKQIICEVCGKSFTDRGTLKTHILLLHIKKRDFKCIICNQLFPLKGTLAKHLKRHQRKEGAVKEFNCTECGMQYFDKSSLKRHYDTKHSGADFKQKCPFCNKAYTTKTNLLKHTNKHHRDKQLVDVIF